MFFSSLSTQLKVRSRNTPVEDSSLSVTHILKEGNAVTHLLINSTTPQAQIRYHAFTDAGFLYSPA